jgi:uncharacterized membrane protein
VEPLMTADPSMLASVGADGDPSARLPGLDQQAPQPAWGDPVRMPGNGTTGRGSKSSPWRVAEARWRFAIAAVVGLIAAAVTLVVGGWELSPVVGWDFAALVVLGWTWRTVWPMNATQTKQLAATEDPTQPSTDLLLLSAAIASLAAVGLVLVLASSASGVAKGALAGLAIVSVALAWLVVHTLFTLRYALLYYRAQPAGGVSFNQDEPPQYSDFAYLALTLGMTFQVSDTDLQSNAIRTTALRHALLSYLFGAVILATTINLIAGLGSGGG